MKYNPNEAANDPSNLPADYETLTAGQKTILRAWIDDQMPLAQLGDRTSYGLKHIFEASASGFYITNGQFKGAMLAAGYEPEDRSDLNWNFI